jgi:hypothetical protein
MLYSGELVRFDDEQRTFSNIQFVNRNSASNEKFASNVGSTQITVSGRLRRMRQKTTGAAAAAKVNGAISRQIPRSLG